MSRGQEILALVAMAAGLCACGQRDIGEQKKTGEGILVTVASATQTVTANASRNVFEWNNGDIINVFNDRNTQASKFSVGPSAKSISAPEGVKTLYGLNPYSTNSKTGPESASVNLPATQQQSKPGLINSDFWPMYAKSAVRDNAATLEFKPAAAAFVFNIFRTDGSAAAEKVTKVTALSEGFSGHTGTATVDLTADNPMYLTGDDNSQSLCVNLASAQAVATEKPDLENYGGQIFISLGRAAYKGVNFEVKTTLHTYTFPVEQNHVFDLTDERFCIINFDLSKLSVSTLVKEGNKYTEKDISPAGECGIASPIAYNGDSDVDWDIIPDFSRVGYKYGDEEIPTLPVKETISPESVSRALSSGDFQDTTSYIQSVIDKVGRNGGGTVLFKEGTYNTAGLLYVDYDNTVLRGETRDATIINATGPIKRCVIYLGKSVAAGTSTALQFAGRKISESSLRCADQYNNFGNTYIVEYNPTEPGISHSFICNITEDYVPVGRLYFEVENPDAFYIGEEIAIFRPHNNDWISDIGMDKIAKNGREVINSGTQQWNTLNFNRYWERTVTGIRGNRIYIDAPVVMAIDAAYGGGKVYKSTAKRISGSGIENITVTTEYYKNENDPNSYYKGEWIDENHAWDAIMIKNAKHCWVKNVNSYHMGYALVYIGTGGKNITVQDCSCMEPVSIVNGGRRYAFNLFGGELCLIKNCKSQNDRHAFITNVSSGPNVFLNCVATEFTGSIGPHQHWGTGDLYDNVNASTKGGMEVYDRGNNGTGHGWAGANYVFWNCTAKQIYCQSPWSRINTPQLETMPGGYEFHSGHPSGNNYVVGFTGMRGAKTAKNYESPYSSSFPSDGIVDYYVQLGFGSKYPIRPNASMYPFISENQTNSIRISLPNKSAAETCDWWPRFTLTTFTHPESLYECQLEDRHYRGIYLNNLQNQ